MQTKTENNALALSKSYLSEAFPLFIMIMLSMVIGLGSLAFGKFDFAIGAAFSFFICWWQLHRAKKKYDELKEDEKAISKTDN